MAHRHKRYNGNVNIYLFVLVISLYLVPSWGQTESEILLEFKASLGNTRALVDWNTDSSVCDGDRANWIGVLCGEGLVWGLQLETMGLTGTIDVDSLAKLEDLKTLSLLNNEFGGALPEFKKLGGLRSLYLSNNQFSGEIPEDAFEGMIKLKKLYLSENKFTGEIPSSLAGLSKLTALKLQQNEFTGQLPKFTAKFESFNASHNMLEGPIPPSLSQMDASAFSGNKGLCSKPLPACKPGIHVTGAPAPSPMPTTATATRSIVTDSLDLDNDDQTDDPRGPIRNPSTTSLVFVTIVVGAAVCGILAAALILTRRRKHTIHQPSIEAPPPDASHHKRAPSQDHTNKVPAGAAAAVVAATAAAEVKLTFVREDRGKFELQDLLKASAEILGSGCFGASYKAALTSGQVMVVKRFKQMNNVGREEFHEHMRRLGRLKHANLLPLVAYYYRKEEKLLVHDFVPCGSLAFHLHGQQQHQPSLEWDNRLKIIKGVAKGLAYLYKELPSMMAPHGHLKSNNVLLDENFEPYLTDYALIPVINSESAQELMVAYKSPEYLRHGRVTKKTDVWSLGMLILEVITGQLPATFLKQGVGGDGSSVPSRGGDDKEVDLATWVTSIPEEQWWRDVIDKQLWEEMNNHNKGEMVKLVKIGVSCCREDVEKRPDLKEALERIDDVKVNDGDNFDDDFFSLHSEGFGAVGVVGDRRKPSRELSADFSDIS
ncbi:Pollen receptor-like kinase 1 [Linum grandiflorum]